MKPRISLRLGITRRTLIKLGLVACVVSGATVAGCSKSDSEAGNAAQKASAANLTQHNVLLVTLDTTRADYLGCYNPERAELTPILDGVAKDGVRFEFAIAQAASTPVSHASILTGLNPYQHGVRVISAEGGYKLSTAIPTLATELQRHGWQTAAFLSGVHGLRVLRLRQRF